jgi:hypothetical protein
MHCLADLKLLLINVDSKMCNAMSSCQPKWVEEVEHSYATDPSSQEMIAKLALDGGMCHIFLGLEVCFVTNPESGLVLIIHFS